MNFVLNAGEGLVATTTRSYSSYSGAVCWDSTRQAQYVASPTGVQFIDPPTASVSLSAEVMEVLMWAHQKMEQEKELNALCESNTALNEARHQFNVLLALVKN